MEKITKNISLRVSVLLLILIILDFCLLEQKWLILAGLFFGGIFGVVKYKLTEKMLKNLFETQNQDDPGNAKKIKRKTIAVLSVAYILILSIFFITANININLFIGFVSGILTVPAVIFFSSIIYVIFRRSEK